MTFNPKQHLTKVKGKDYLEVKWRLVWFREEHPDYTIDTEFLILDMDQGIAVCQATISDENNRQLAQGTKTEYKSKFFDFVEKAETGAIGRALAHLGYGTQFAPEMEVEDLEGKERLADSPVGDPETDSNNKQSSSSNGKNKELINEINQYINDFAGDAQKLLEGVTGKKSMEDCDSQQLTKYLNVLKNKVS